MRTTPAVRIVCYTLLLLVLSISTAVAQDDFIRITTTTPWGFDVVQSIVETPGGATLTKEVRYPQAAGVKRGEVTMSSGQFVQIADQLIALGVNELGDLTQPNIEDAATHHFEGRLAGETIDFTVYGVLSDLHDTRYVSVLRVLKQATYNIEMEEVQQ